MGVQIEVSTTSHPPGLSAATSFVSACSRVGTWMSTKRSSTRIIGPLWEGITADVMAKDSQLWIPERRDCSKGAGIDVGHEHLSSRADPLRQPDGNRAAPTPTSRHCQPARFTEHLRMADSPRDHTAVRDC